MNKLFASKKGIPNEELRPYLTTPPPPLNPYIAKTLLKDDSQSDAMKEDIRSTGSHHSSSSAKQDRLITPEQKLFKTALMPYLLYERAEAVEALREYLLNIGVLDCQDGLRDASHGMSKKAMDAINILKAHCDAWVLF